jgi:hypothetical protein
MEDLTIVYTVPGDLRAAIAAHVAASMGQPEKQPDGSVLQRPVWADEGEFLKTQLDAILHQVAQAHPTEEMKAIRDRQIAAEQALVAAVRGRTAIHRVEAAKVQSLLG